MQHSGIDMMYDLYDVKSVFRAWHGVQSASFVGKKTKGRSIPDGWPFRKLLMEFWKTLTVIVGLDVQQDVVPDKKHNWSVLVFVPLAIAQILPTRIQTTQNDLMAMTLDSMEYLKYNDGNALRYYLRSATDQYLFTYWIFSFGSTVFIL
jgi:hypothetical protein